MNNTIKTISYISMIGLLSACSGVIVTPGNPVNSPITVMSTKPSEIKTSVSSVEVKPSAVVQSDNSLASKINDVVIPSSSPIIIPSSITVPSTISSQASSNSLSNLSGSESPIKPEDRGQGQPATPCDGYGVNSQQCLTYLESQKPSKPLYSRVEPIPPLTGGHIEMTFKDEYKIRYRKEENRFISLTGADVSSINYLLISDKIPGLYQSDISEEKSEEYEKLESESCGCDARNSLSFLSFGVKEVNLTEFVMTLRNNPFVREANVFNGSNGAG